MKDVPCTHCGSPRALPSAACWQIGDLVLLSKTKQWQWRKQSRVTCLGPRSTSWCSSHSPGKLFQDAFWQPWGVGGVLLGVFLPLNSFLSWKQTWTKTSSQPVQKSLPNIFKLKGFNNLLNKPTVRESCFPSASGVTNMPTSNLLSTSGWRFQGSLPVFLFFSFSPPCLTLWCAFWSCGGHALSHSLAQAGTEVHTGTHMGMLKERKEVIKTAWFAWKESRCCLPFCFLSLGGKYASLSLAWHKPLI